MTSLLQKEADVVKTAKADSEFYPSEQNTSEKNQDAIEAEQGGGVSDETFLKKGLTLLRLTLRIRQKVF